MYQSVIILVNLATISFISCADVDLLAIFRKSKQAIDSGSVKQNHEVLGKYYFTNEKDHSVWYHAAIEQKKWYGFTFSAEEHQSVERFVRAMKRQYLRCANAKHDGYKTDCFGKISHLLESNLKDLNFMCCFEGEMFEKNGRAKYGIHYIAYVALSTHLAFVSVDAIKHYNDAIKRTQYIKEFKTILDKLTTYFYRYEVELDMWRTDRVTPVKICDVRYVFWKEFEGVCETRWKRNSEDDNDDSRVEGWEFANNDPELDKADQIGTYIKPRMKKYHAKVIDDVTKKVVYDDYRDGELGKTAEALQQLYKEGAKARWKYVDELFKKLKKFDNGTIGTVRQMVDSVVKTFTD